MDYNPPPFPGAPMNQPPQPPTNPKKRRRGGHDDDGSVVTKKVVDRNRRFAIIFAVIVAVVVAVVVMGGTAPSTYVVRAKVAIAAGTAIEPSAHLEAVAVPDEFIEDGTLTAKSEKAALKLAAEELSGVRAQYPLVKGQQVHEDSFNVELTLSTPLEPDERLMSVQAGIANAVAAQIKPGDRVDVAATADGIAAVILNDVQVVSVTVSESQYQALASQQTGEKKDSKAEELLPGAPIPGIYVVRVSAEDAPRLYAAQAGGDLTLIYRGEEALPLATEPLTARDVICGGDAQIPDCED